jgi:hypothetical protein
MTAQTTMALVNLRNQKREKGYRIRKEKLQNEPSYLTSAAFSMLSDDFGHF